jgi:hypothetical protein
LVYAQAFGEAGIVRILLAASKVGPARADGDWRFFASTLSTNFIKNGLLVMAKHAVFGAEPLAPLTRRSLPEILFTVSAASSCPALVITAAVVARAL